MPINATLYMSSKEANTRSDLNKIKQLLDKLKNSKKLDYKITDTAKMTPEECDHAYAETILPSVFNKYQVRKVFGTNRHSGVFFGKEQPALLLKGDMWEVYPHIKNGKTISIEKFLGSLTKALVD